MSVAAAIRKIAKGSDVSPRSKAYGEIEGELTRLGLNLAFFVFATSEHSSCARTLDGDTRSYPVITLYVKYNADLNKTGIDPHRGNWADKWAQTQVVRETVNSILQRHGFDDDHVSDYMFVFVRSLEELAFHEIGRECKAAIKRLVCDEIPGAVVSHVFWNGQKYAVIMRDKADCKRVKRDAKAKLAKAIPKTLAAADKKRHCRTYKAAIEFGHAGMNLSHLTREDL